MHVAPRPSVVVDLSPIFDDEASSAVDLMWRDLQLLGSLGIALIALSAVLSIVFAMLRSRLALLALLGCVLLGVSWYGYYAFDLQNPGLSGALMTAILMFGIWAVLIVSAGRLVAQRRSRSAP